MSRSARASYQTMDVTFMSAPRRLVLLYSHLIANLRKAGRAIELRDHPGRSEALCKSRDIVDELAFSLDQAAGGELATNLLGLYEYFKREITQVDFHPDTARLARVTSLIETLHEAWDQAAAQLESPSAAATAP